MENGSQITYKDAGVNQERKDRTVDKFLKMMRGTYGPRVMDLHWGFAGLYSLNYPSKLFKKNYTNPVMVAGADGVGTKLRIAQMMNKHDTIGIDLVAMNVNDLIVTGAEPLFFLDYLAFCKLDESIMLDIVKGIVKGCKKASCALLGGETAEMPGYYSDGEYELAGFSCGVVEKDRIITGKNVRVGDTVLGLSSSGIHSNGYSLVRKILFETNHHKVDEKFPELNCSLGEELLKPTRIYVGAIQDVCKIYRVKKAIKGIANITGGGMIENLPRILPKNCSAEINKGSWNVNPIFKIMQKEGNVPDSEMYRVFNMGVGMAIVTDPFFAAAVIKRLDKIGEKATVIGRIVRGQQDVRIV